MTKTLPLLAMVAAALAGCNQSDSSATANEASANAANAAAPVKLPPSIVASHPYRCKDNSLISIDWMTDGTANSARLTPQGKPVISLTQAEAGGPYTAEGASLTGDPKEKAITYNGQSCTR